MKRYDPVQIDDYGGASRGQVDESKDGDFIIYADHLAAMKELTNKVRLLADRLAQVEKERDELKGVCGKCKHDFQVECPCIRHVPFTSCIHFKPRDPSAEQGVKNG